MTTRGYYAANGSMNVTVVDGTSYTGLHAADGSINVVSVSGTTYVGAYAPCGAWNVLVSTPGTRVGRHAPCGALYVSETTSADGAQKVTVVSGSLSGGSTAGTPIGLLLVLTHAA